MYKCVVYKWFISLPLKQTSVWPNWYGVQEDLSVEEPAPTLPPAPSFSHLDMPPPYEAVSGGNLAELAAMFPFFVKKKPSRGSAGGTSRTLATARAAEHVSPPLCVGGETAAAPSFSPKPR